MDHLSDPPRSVDISSLRSLGGVFERFSEPARQAVALAGDEASTLNHEHIGTGHVLLGLLRQRKSTAARVLESLGITLEDARAQVVAILGVGQESSSGQKGFSPRASMVLELAVREALSLGDGGVATHHILLALWRDNEGVGASVLLRLQVDDERVPEEITRMLAGEKRHERPGDKGAAQREGTSPSERTGGVRSWDEFQHARSTARARLRRELRAGSLDPAEVIRSPSPQALSARVFDVLLIAGGSPIRAHRAMKRARISPYRKLDALSERQRRKLIKHWSDPPSQGPAGTL